MSLFSLIRYRFFLFAGLLPYLLGAGWAYGRDRMFDPAAFWTGLLGIVLAVVGVECFNEYYDSRLGTDRVFNPSDEDPIPDWVLPFGWGAFLLAGAVGLWLGVRHGWPVFLYMGLGGLAAVFYVGPPVRWAYRGFGETMIALSYGPWMTLGSHWLQTGRWSWPLAAASLVPGLMIAALAVANEIPDFYQDRMVGKRNLVVRLGRRGGARLYQGLSAASLVLPPAGALVGVFPPAAAASVLAIPLWARSVKVGTATYENPRAFTPAVQAVVQAYLLAASIFTLAVTLG